VNSTQANNIKCEMLRSLADGITGQEAIEAPASDLKARQKQREHIVVLEECQRVLRRALTPHGIALAVRKVRAVTLPYMLRGVRAA
jgi:hypothetical protein